MINISSLDFSLTEAIRAEINRVGDVIFKHLDDGEKIDITLSKVSPTVFKVNIQARYKGEEIVSHHESHNFHKALDLSCAHFIKQIDRKKDFVNSKRRQRA